ncbi:MAG: isoprenylcysteine carboxylmethyltransferase family protein [Anaerolineae bacterium]|nr:isoprenylcysteine carboxylmethyltransferase family protein [Anaerolineae bacterium]
MSRLLVRTMAGFAFLLAVLALALFLSAGTLAFWQAWVYLAVFAVCTILITLYLIRYDQRLLASRVQAGPVAETRQSQQVIQSLASLFFVGLFVIPGLDFRYHWSTVPAAVSLLADGLVALGFVFVFLVFRENSFTSAVIEVAQEQRVVTSGPYSLVRHPMYAGASLLVFFTPLALGSWVAIICAVPLILVIAARLLDEETYLAANLSGYAAYRQQVRYRLVPFVW